MNVESAEPVVSTPDTQPVQTKQEQPIQDANQTGEIKPQETSSSRHNMTASNDLSAIKAEIKVDTSLVEDNKQTNLFNVKNDQSSIENLMVSNINNISDTRKTQWWSMKDFNNVIEADRKLIVNKSQEYFVHDEVLVTYSDYFAELLGRQVNLNNSTDEDDRITDIDIPHDKKFFDILFWMYSRDSKKLKKASKNFHDFLKLISLGIHLKLKPEFFEILLNKLAFQWKEEFFFDPLWSRKIFTFPVLEKIIDEMKTNNFTKNVGKFTVNFYSSYVLVSRYGL